MKEILDSIENGQFAQAREQIINFGFSNFASILDGYLNCEIINQETFNKAALIALYAAEEK